MIDRLIRWSVANRVLVVIVAVCLAGALGRFRLVEIRVEMSIGYRRVEPAPRI